MNDLMAVEIGVDARRALLERLIDHAPLFPPASMEMSEALAVDRRAGAGDEAFMLARFVCPASRLAELGDEQRALSVVLDGPLPENPRIEAVETRAPADLSALVGIAPEVYVELPVDGRLEGQVAGLARLGLRAKVRCGGAASPSVSELARFVRVCRQAGVVFKATAGLHHPFSHAGEHGFLNLLAACVFGGEEVALAEDDPAAIALDRESFRWRGREAGAEELARVRATVFHSIGSCSVAEPVQDLRALGVLPL